MRKEPMAIFEIPLKPATPTTMTAQFPNGNSYKLTLKFANVLDGGWILDIADENGVALVCGIPLVTGADLLAPYAYLGIGGPLYVVSDGWAAAVPTFNNLGVDSHLYIEG